MKSWFCIDGDLEPIAVEEPGDFRFPLALAEWVITHFSTPGQWVFDPFCGFGTALIAAQRLGREAIGFEKDPRRAAYASAQVKLPGRVFQADVRQHAQYRFPKCNLLFTSPPYTSFREWNEDGFRNYFSDLQAIFESFIPILVPDAQLVIEMSNIREEHGIRTLAWDAARTLGTLFFFQGEIVRCNTGGTPAGPGYEHSYLLVFKRM